MEVTRIVPGDVLKLPDNPGVYRFFNEEDELIYVGKAKSLKNMTFHTMPKSKLALHCKIPNYNPKNASKYRMSLHCKIQNPKPPKNYKY